MKLPFFRKRKAKKEAEEARKAAEQEAEGSAAPAEPEAASPQPAKGKGQPSTQKTRRVPAEQVVDAIGYALAAVPSLGPTVKAWRKLGFAVSDAYTWQGCHAAHIDLEGGGIRFLAADSHAEASAAADLVRQRLILGSGLFGWSWSCAEPHRSAVAIGQLAGSDFHQACEDWSDDIVQIPMELTPAAATWLERPPAEPVSPSHANSIVRLDHVVLQVSASKAAAQTYEKHFGLKGRTSAMNDRYYAFLKAGRSLLEIVGPIKPGAAEKPQGKSAPRITGGPWGVAFGSTNIDATVTFLRMAGIDVGDPHRAVQGGRITGMTTPLGGIQLAFMGD